MNLERLMQWPFEDIVQAYALGLGLGHDSMDPAQLRFVFEGAQDFAAFPTMPVVLCHPGQWTGDPATGISRSQQVHGEQGIVIHRPLQPAGRLRGRTRVTGVIDKGEGRGALLYTERDIVVDESGEPAALRSIAVRFSAPVVPGETVSFELWRDGPIVTIRA
jgi:acyl dehydratase